MGVILLILIILGTTISVYYTQFETPHTQQDYDTLYLLEQTSDIYIISQNPESFSRAFYSYGAIYYNSTSILGWFDQDIPPDIIQDLKDTDSPLTEEGCTLFKDQLDKYSIKEIITYNEYCDTLAFCGFNLIEQKNNVCLYTFPATE